MSAECIIIIIIIIRAEDVVRRRGYIAITLSRCL